MARELDRSAARKAGMAFSRFGKAPARETFVSALQEI
jgi:hypothetical protein